VVSVRRVLVTGATGGFVGSHLLRALDAPQQEAVAAAFDLTDFAAVEATVRAGPWDTVVHLAALSHVPTCEADPSLAFRVNLAGTAHLLEAMRRHAPEAWLVFASSGQVYAPPAGGETAGGRVIDEDWPIAPQNVYARTKWEAELLVQDAARREGLRSTIVRLFNHTHKSQLPSFFLPHLYKTILERRSGPGRIRVPVGNLNLARDIGSLQDLIGAFVSLLARGPRGGPEVFNVSSGSAKRLSDVASELARQMNAEVEFVPELARMRPDEPAVVLGSHRRFTQQTGWNPTCKDAAQLVKYFLAD